MKEKYSQFVGHEFSIREMLARDPRTSPEDLRKIAKDADVSGTPVTETVLNNPHTPDKIRCAAARNPAMWQKALANPYVNPKMKALIQKKLNNGESFITDEELKAVQEC